MSGAGITKSDGLMLVKEKSVVIIGCLSSCFIRSRCGQTVDEGSNSIEIGLLWTN